MNGISRDNRSTQRRGLNLECFCRFAGGAITNAEVLDITSRGAKVKLTGLHAQFGDRVEILFKEHERILGIVRRVDGEYAGLELDKTLPEFWNVWYSITRVTQSSICRQGNRWLAQQTPSLRAGNELLTAPAENIMYLCGSDRQGGCASIHNCVPSRLHSWDVLVG